MSANFNYCVSDGVMNAALSGRIDTTTAPVLQEQLLNAVKDSAAKKVILNCAELDYISSAGLRVMLLLKKRVGDVSLIEVSSEVYEIFEMTGFIELMSVSKAFHHVSIEGCDLIGQGANGLVYRLDPERVVKVYKNPDSLDEIYNERELARKAFILGLPTAIPFDIVKVGERYGSVFELLNANSMTRCIRNDPENIDSYLRQYVDLLKLIHDTADPRCEMPRKKAAALHWAEVLKGYLDEELRQKYIALVEAVPERNTIIHGDYHINNIEMQNGELMLIDMDTLCIGHPVFDFGGMHTAYIGFPEMSGGNVVSFFGLPMETCRHIWEYSTVLYAGSEEAAVKLREKGALLSYAYLSRWVVDHKLAPNEAPTPYMRHCLDELSALIRRTDTLSF